MRQLGEPGLAPFYCFNARRGWAGKGLVSNNYQPQHVIICKAALFPDYIPLLLPSHV